MAYLGGPIGPRRRRGIYLHDPPPGYHPPRTEMPAKDRQRLARRDWILMRVATVVLILVAAAFMVIILMLIATHS
jgi:hypothetical protein